MEDAQVATEIRLKGTNILAHRIRISEILPWDRKSYLTHAIFTGCHVRATYIGCIGTQAHGCQVTSLLC